MLALDKETFSYWVTHPEDLTPIDLTLLQESVTNYPYCQSLYTLMAKAASVHQRSQTIPYARQAAAHALSRNALRKLIDNEFQWSENLLSKLNELSAKHVPVPDEYQQESYALFQSETGIGTGILKLSSLNWIKPIEPIADEKPATLVMRESLPETPTPPKARPKPVKATPAIPVALSADADRQRQIDLIDSFIKNEPRIAPIKNQPEEAAEQEDLTTRSKPAGINLVTESFAKILERQGKTDKAIDIYKKLMVKNPEKKAYFAAKISGLTGESNA